MGYAHEPRLAASRGGEREDVGMGNLPRPVRLLWMGERVREASDISGGGSLAGGSSPGGTWENVSGKKGDRGQPSVADTRVHTTPVCCLHIKQAAGGDMPCLVTVTAWVMWPSHIQ